MEAGAVVSADLKMPLAALTACVLKFIALPRHRSIVTPSTECLRMYEVVFCERRSVPSLHAT